VVIAVVGKYTGMADSYLSVIKALQHASLQTNKPLQIRWICSDDLQEVAEPQKGETEPEEDKKRYVDSWKALRSADGILVPGGFGDRGVEGKVCAAEHYRCIFLVFL
jgi:CTP synthase